MVLKLPMQVRKSVLIEADATSVWPFVADPALQQLWNPKVVSVQRARSGPVFTRERFQMSYFLSGKNRQSQVEVLTFEPPLRVVFRHKMIWRDQEQTAEESYQITECHGCVEVVQTMDLSQLPIPWPARALISVISRFGRSIEEPYLEKLKGVVEQRKADQERG